MTKKNDIQVDEAARSPIIVKLTLKYQEAVMTIYGKNVGVNKGELRID
jgi:hypothetical protein